MKIEFPYGKRRLAYDFEDAELPAHSVDEALTLAKALLGKASVTITAIPDGIGVVVNAK